MLSHLRRTLNDFISNETGFVRQRTGLPVAWAAGVLVAAAVLLGAPNEAAAHCSAGVHTMDNCSGPTCDSWCKYVHGCQAGYCGTASQCVCISPG